MNNYEYVDVKNVTLTGKLDRSIRYRSNISIAVCFVFGVAVFFLPSIIAKILGVFFVAMALMVLFLVKNRPTMDIYDNGILLYHPDEDGKVMFLPYEHMVEFEGKNDNGAEAIKFVMDNEQVVFKTTFNTGDAMRGIRKYAQSKELREIKKKEFQESMDRNNPFKKWFNKRIGR